MLAFHIEAQNAALLIRRRAHEYIFEAFEVSCPNEVVTSSLGRLERTFPGEAMVILQAQMDDATFRKPFAEMLSKMHASTPQGAYRVTKKAGEVRSEIRDAIKPKYFTEMVFAILRSMGEPADIARIHKFMRDEVLWSNVLYPWRRSPLWTVLRVS